MQIMTASYNERLSTKFSRSVRNTISEVKVDPDLLVYNDIFPDTKIKYGESSASLWALEGMHASYLATSPGGSATGFGSRCFPGDTKVMTEYGEVKISELYEKRISQVLSWCHKDGILKVGKIRAFRRKIGNEFVKITTDTGRTVNSTVDHRFFTEERWYIRADKLQVGETFKTIPRDLRKLRGENSGERQEVSRMLRQGTSSNGRYEVSRMRSRLSDTEIRERETNKAWSKGNILHKRLFMQIPREKSKNKKMFNLRKLRILQQKLLFRKVQNTDCGKQGIEEVTNERKKPKTMSVLQQVLLTEDKGGISLFSRVRGQNACYENDWDEQFKLQGREPLQKNIQRVKTNGFKKGWLLLSELWSKRKKESNKTLRRSNEFACSSYRSQQAQQHNGKSVNFMSNLSCETSQNEKITSLEFYKDEQYVYDIQVDDYHNFFANGILVHNCLIIDDLIKNAYEANNANILEDQKNWFLNTMLSRLEKGGKIIVIMTRWHSEDLAGYVLNEFPKMGFRLKHINMKAKSDDGVLLCEDLLPENELELRRQALGADIFSANYQQEPIDIKGKLYGDFKTWSVLPNVHSEVKMYMDTADTGADFLSGFIYVEDHEHNIYIKDIIHTDEPMEKTEPLTAQSIIDNQVRTAVIESNNGGRGFKRAVEKEVKIKGYYSCNFVDFHQSKNKESRILSNATTVMNKVYMPELWDIKYPEVYKFFAKYQRTGKNAHDDLADAITGVVERSQQQNAELQTGSRVFGRRR